MAEEKKSHVVSRQKHEAEIQFLYERIKQLETENEATKDLQAQVASLTSEGAVLREQLKEERAARKGIEEELGGLQKEQPLLYPAVLFEATSAEADELATVVVNSADEEAAERSRRKLFDKPWEATEYFVEQNPLPSEG